MLFRSDYFHIREMNALLGNIGSNLKQIANALDISIIEADKDDYSEKEYNGSLQRIDGA